MAWTTVFALSASCRLPAAAKSMVVARAPPLMSAAVRPPFASSSIASPAWDAPKMVSAPICNARSESSAMFADGSSSAPSTRLMLLSKSDAILNDAAPAATMAGVAVAVMAMPTFCIPLPTFSAALFRASDFSAAVL